MVKFRIALQLAEACGSDNRYYCSKALGRAVADEETLLRYYIKSGGAADFDRRFKEAMGALNRWFCSEYFGFDVRDPEMLWDYYVKHAAACSQARAAMSVPVYSH